MCTTHAFYHLPIALLQRSATWPFGASSSDPFRDHEQQPSTGTVTARFLGTTSVLFQDRDTAILSDGFVTRPSFAAVGLGRIAPDSARIERTLQRLEMPRVAAVFAGHSHYDHALDAPVFPSNRFAWSRMARRFTSASSSSLLWNPSTVLATDTPAPLRRLSSRRHGPGVGKPVLHGQC